jgi:hypothetical protein
MTAHTATPRITTLRPTNSAQGEVRWRTQTQVAGSGTSLMATTTTSHASAVTIRSATVGVMFMEF